MQRIWKKSYEREYEPNFENMGVNDIEIEDVEEYVGNFEQLKVSERLVHCVHGKYGKMGVRLSVGRIVCCGLIDTGAQI